MRWVTLRENHSGMETYVADFLTSFSGLSCVRTIVVWKQMVLEILTAGGLLVA